MPPKYATICPRPCKLTFDLLTLKVVSESRVTWATFFKPVLVFLGLSVLDLGPMYATDRRQTDVRRASSLNAPYPRGGGIINKQQKQTEILNCHRRNWDGRWPLERGRRGVFFSDRSRASPRVSPIRINVDHPDHRLGTGAVHRVPF